MNKNKILVFSPELTSSLHKSLRRQYNVFLLSLIGYILFLSKGPIKLPLVSDDLAIQAQSFSVLLTLGLIPFSLWNFGKQVTRISELDAWEDKAREYRRKSLLRLALLWLTIFINISFYFFTTSYSFLLCAGMGLVASMFCIPSLKKIKCDLFEEEEVDEAEDVVTPEEKE